MTDDLIRCFITAAVRSARKTVTSAKLKWLLRSFMYDFFTKNVHQMIIAKISNLINNVTGLDDKLPSTLHITSPHVGSRGNCVGG